MPDRGWIVPRCRGEALPRPPAPWARARAGRVPGCGDDRDRPPTGLRGAMPALAGRTGQAAPDPYQTGVAPTRRRPMPHRGWVGPRCRGEALPRPPAPEARHMRDASRHAAMIATDRRWVSPVICRPWRAGRVRQRLTPTWRLRRSVAHRCPTGDASPYPCRGEARPRPPAPPGAVTRGTHRHAATVWNGTPDERRWDGLPALAGRTGQAAPDPYRAGVAPTRGAHVPDRGCTTPRL
jgi:hypothetical protein